MKFSEYAQHDALGLAELVRTGAVSAQELLEAAIARADAVNPRLNAVVTPMHEQARGQLADLDAGPFAGVPFLLKDLGVEYAGVIA